MKNHNLLSARSKNVLVCLLASLGDSILSTVYLKKKFMEFGLIGISGLIAITGADQVWPPEIEPVQIHHQSMVEKTAVGSKWS